MLLNADFKPLYSAPNSCHLQDGWIKTGWFGVISELKKFAFPEGESGVKWPPNFNSS